MTRARNSANLASHGNLFVDITNDRTGIGSVVPAQNLHVAGTAGFHADVTLTGDLYNTVWDRSDNSLKFVDNAKAKFGTGGDLEVYHNGTNAYIDNKTNRLWIRNNTAGNTGHAIILQALSGQTSINLMPGGAAELYHANQKKFETTAYGTNTTGTAVNDGLVVAGVATVTTMNVTGVLTYDDVTSIDSVGIITARSNIDCNGNLDVAGTSNFVGDATFNGGAGAVTIPANSDMRFINGTWSGDVSGNVAKIQHHSNILYISGGSSGIYFRENNTNRWFISDGGHFISGADSTYDIGTSGNRVRNGYFDTLYGDGSNLTGIAADKIFEGNSSVEVIDTGTGKIDVIADGSYVSRFQKVNGNRTYMLVGNPQAVSNDYGTNNGHLIVLGNTNAEPATLRLFGWGAGLSDGTVNNRIEFASQQSGSGGQTFAKIETVVRGSSDNSSDMTFHTASSATVSEKLRITSAGKVGINESSPLGKLHVKTGDSGVSAVGSSADELVLESSTNAGMSILSATNGEGAINFGDSGDNNIGKLVYSHADNSMQFKTNDTERLRIISGGSIGIGIASPQRLLHQHISNSNATYHAFTNSTTGSGVHDGMVIGISGAEEAIFWNYEATPMRFATSGSERVRIDSSGRLFVNRTSQHASSSEKLSVNGMTSIQLNSTSTAPLYVFNEDTTGSGTVQPFVFLHDGSGIRGGLGLQYSTSNFIINAVNVLQFRTGSSGVAGSERARIDNGGLRVNKTTTSDYGKFEVKGGTADDIETADITAKTIATFSGSTPGTTAAGKGAGIVIKPIADRGCNYFFGVANSSTNQEAIGDFIVRAGNLANSTVERFRIQSGGAFGINGENYGTSGQVLTSSGNNSAPTWTTITGTTINNNADNRVITGSGTANTLNGESTLTYNGSVLHFSQSSDEKIILAGSANPYIRFREGSSDKAYIQWNSNGNLQFVNQESGEYLRVGSGGNGLTFVHNGVTSTVWHSGNDGSGSGLDADTLDGISSASFLRSDASDVIGGILSYHSNQARLQFRNTSYNTYLYIGGWDGGTNSASISRIRTSNDNLHIDAGANGQCYLNYYSQQPIYATTIYPRTNNTFDLGSTTYRWRNLYTQDLQLSNEAQKDEGGNDVDGTWGDWTLQEGEEKIYMINNRTGKKYSLMMKEEV